MYAQKSKEVSKYSIVTPLLKAKCTILNNDSE